MIQLAVSGCQGRMGQRITHLALADCDFRVKTLLESPNHPQSQGTVEGLKISTDPKSIKDNEVLIEFTTPEATMIHLKACVENGVNMVIGTTGLSTDQIKTIQDAAEKIAIVFSSNMSIGVNILFKLAQVLSASAPLTYKVKMTEAHHIHKKDAPSGTAKTLADVIKSGSQHKVEDIQSIRDGEIIGDHDVMFESAEDIITIKHHAKNRDIFAKGALVAAKFLKNKKTGLYNMQDVLGLK